jgi:hypothetical protein
MKAKYTTLKQYEENPRFWLNTNGNIIHPQTHHMLTKIANQSTIYI